MPIIRGKEMVLDKLGFWFPISAVINNIKSYMDNSGEQILELSVIPSTNKTIGINMIFKGVDQVSLPINYTSGIGCALLEIIDVSETGLNNTNWYIGDFKIDSIFFTARSIEVVAVEKLCP